MSYAKIIGTGSYLPSKMMSNRDLEGLVETSDEWIVSRTGIKNRHIAAEDETTTSMAEKAAKEALKAANLNPTDIELIIVATATPESFFPTTACLLQQRLDIPACIAFDMSAACSGFIYALDLAEKYIRTGTVKTALVVGAETLSRAIDWKDRNTCVLFGDGAGAVVLQQNEQPGIFASKLSADGRHQNLLTLPTGLYRNEPQVISMRGREVFKIAVESMVASVKDLLAAQEMSVQDVDWIIPHQANIRIINAILNRLEFPIERVIVTVNEHANTSAASIPLALDKGIREHRIKPGQTLLLEAFGGGLTWGGMLLKY